MTTRIIAGDCRDVLATLPDASVDAIVTDPPYGLGFMGKDWDHEVPGVHFWEAMYRVMKPGAHLLAFGGTRTSHRIAVAIEDAGFEIRDTLMWLYGSGFPKSLDVSKAIDKAAGAEREVSGYESRHINRPATDKWDKSAKDREGYGMPGAPQHGGMFPVTAPATPEAERWQGWGTALKPAYEPIILARKPLAGTVAANVLAHGTGALNIDGCRLTPLTDAEIARSGKSTNGDVYGTYGSVDWKRDGAPVAGRWPANVLLDEDAAAALDEMSGQLTSGGPAKTRTDKKFNCYGTYKQRPNDPATYNGGDTGGASRFFYVAKASRAERNAGLDGMPERDWRGNYGDGIQDNRPHTKPGYEYHAKVQNHHPTVKPISLMQWLIRLVTPPGGTVLDPFMGSGSTGVACLREGVNFIGIELDDEYAEIARRRITGDAPLFADVALG